MFKFKNLNPQMGKDIVFETSLINISVYVYIYLYKMGNDTVKFCSHNSNYVSLNKSFVFLTYFLNSNSKNNHVATFFLKNQIFK